ncbi:hypothetical protein [Mycobacterium phage MS810]
MSVLDEIAAERARQEARWGEQNHPDAVLTNVYPIKGGDYCKAITEARSAQGQCTYADILIEEVAEAIDEARLGDKAALRVELIQVAAVATKWVEKLDRGY